MFDHVMLKVGNYDEAKAFYTAALKPLGLKVIKEVPEPKACGFGTYFPGFWITEGADPISSPAHIALRAPTRAHVRQFYEAALQAGAQDNGAPGFRPQYHKLYYGAFVLDPFGYNIEAVTHVPEGLLEWLRLAWETLRGLLCGGKTKQS